ncbi:MAG: outer membrane protein precursor, partial [Polaromonas sp.]|jgi:outer membrane protein OmpA-like peptidoglycan-associated protein|nr:outer membrane protein precursor [Polaromonas sp.]
VQAGYLWGKGGARERTLGLEVGYQAMKDLWISAGYNWLGLKDKDLTGADYTSKGIYLRLRFKFDETSLGFAPAGAARNNLVPQMPAAAPAPAAEPTPESEAAPVVAVPLAKTTLQSEAFFDFGQAVLKPQAHGTLDELAGRIKAMDYEVVITIGHTDSMGAQALNQKQSEQRAQAVRAHLIAQGVEASRITAQGRGDSQPVADNRTAEGRAQNRRVEIEVTGQKLL